MSKRHGNYYVFVKNMVGWSTARVIRTIFCFGCLGETVVQRVPFENHKNKEWYPKPAFCNSSALGPSKNEPWERFWNNMKNQWKNNRKINVFWWSKTIEKYLNTNSFLKFWSSTKTMKKLCQTRPHKSCFLVKKWRHGPPMFDLSSAFWRFGVMPKNDDFWTLSRWSKKS